MKKYIIYGTTLFIHALIAGAWIRFVQYFCGGFVGAVAAMALMYAHRRFFNNHCFIYYCERWIHIKLLGESRIPDLKFKDCIFYKLFKK